MYTKFKTFQGVIDRAGNCYVILNTTQTIDKGIGVLYTCLNILSLEIKEFTSSELTDILDINIEWWKIVIRTIKALGRELNLSDLPFNDLCIWKLYCTLTAFIYIDYNLYKKMLRRELSKYYNRNPPQNIYDSVIDGCNSFGILHFKLIEN